MTTSVNSCAASVTSELEIAAATDNIISPKSYFSTYALRVVCTCAFGINLDDDKKKREAFYSNVRGMFSNKFNGCLILGVIIPHADKILKLCDVSPFPKKTVNFIAGETTKLIDERRKHPELRRDDFLQLLTDASSGTNGDKKDLSTEEVNAQAFSFMIGTYETTATCLHYVAYELALNQHIQDTLKKEINSVVGEAEPTYDNLTDLKYTGYVINETLRKYPTLARLSRHCSESTTIKGVRIPKGSVAVIPIYHIHHDPRLYTDPEEFRPERFDPDSEYKIDPVLYLPFGGGPRMCIGVRFAVLEMKLLLVHAMRRVRFVSCAETEPSPPQFLKSTPLLHTVNPIKLKVVLDPLK
ncbi:cytochrome P450 3A19-like [Mizuhopecten yessoensis]|uniref:cytochrome P450 3A19-like n=1 Tax=Mizuhopecten yessoensis TaxID=6573 RepID=UPI000B45E090|nr:cytochrome P450 3A19-like [Mizuhopecten yessoensis]